jgi:Thioesterase-like superfamily
MNNNSSHPLDEALALVPTTDGRLRGRTSELYWNMVGPFGGATAAVMLNSIFQSKERVGDPVALTVNYLSMVKEGEFVIEARLLRSNRTNQHWSILMIQDEGREIVTSAIAIFGARRPTWSLNEAVRPAVGARETYERFQPRNVMRWPLMYDLRYARGDVRQQNDDSITHAWIADAEPRPLDFLSLTAFCDTFLPRIYMRRPLMVPVGTVSLNIYFHADTDGLAAHGTGPVLGVAQGQGFHKGYFDHHGQMWGGEKLLATTQQLVWFKE